MFSFKGPNLLCWISKMGQNSHGNISNHGVIHRTFWMTGWVILCVQTHGVLHRPKSGVARFLWLSQDIQWGRGNRPCIYRYIQHVHRRGQKELMWSARQLSPFRGLAGWVVAVGRSVGWEYVMWMWIQLQKMYVDIWWHVYIAMNKSILTSLVIFTFTKVIDILRLNPCWTETWIAFSYYMGIGP